jgi:hypothetical protein
VIVIAVESPVAHLVLAVVAAKTVAPLGCARERRGPCVVAVLIERTDETEIGQVRD